MTLLSIQRDFRNHLLAGADLPLQSVAPAARHGLAVYRHAYRAQLVACLRDTFERVWAWLGDDSFDRAASLYIEATPPSAWTLNEYGVGFPDTFRELYPNDLEVAELAWLDWTLRRAFDGPDAYSIRPADLAKVDWDNAVLHFLPTLTVGEVTTNVSALWSALSEGETPPAVEHLPEGSAVRVWRTNLSPKFRSIEHFEQRALLLALAGCSFSDLCMRLVEDDDYDLAAQRVGRLLAGWIRDELITAVRPAMP